MRSHKTPTGGPSDILRALDTGAPLPSSGSGGGGVPVPEEEMGELPPIDRGKPEASVMARRRAELTALPIELRQRKAFELSLRGASIASIAEIFGVTESTVYRWKQARAQEYRASIEQQSGVDLVADTMLFYTYLEELCLYEIDQADRDEKTIDEKTGTVSIVGNRSHAKRVRQGWVDRAHGLRNSKTKLLFEAGVLRREPEKIFHTLRGEDTSDSGEDTSTEITPDEMLKEIERLARFGRRV